MVLRTLFDDMSQRATGGQVGELARLVDKAWREYELAADQLANEDVLASVTGAVDHLEDVVFALHRAQSLALDLIGRVHQGTLSVAPRKPEDEDYAASAIAMMGERFPMPTGKQRSNLERVRDALYHYEDRLRADRESSVWAPVPTVEGLWVDGHLITYDDLELMLLRLHWTALVLISAQDVLPTDATPDVAG